MKNHVGQLLGNYKLVALLAEGGYAKVYEGEHIHLGTHAAVKVLKTIVTDDEIERFRTEARTIASLEHPNIIGVLDFDINEEGMPFLVMELARKGTLKDSRPGGRSLPYVTVVSYIKQIASALQYAHDRRIIHRDVKPANMLILSDDRIVLSDFGIALTVQSGLQDARGTAYYMAPEQINGHSVLASDQYALAIVTYEWLSGDVPFRGTPEEVCAQHLSAQPPGINGKVPLRVEQVIMRALEKDPQLRFPRIQDFADVLENTYQQEEQAAQDTTSPISLAAPTVLLPAIHDTQTHFSVPVVQPIESAGALISRYDSLLRAFHKLNTDYTNALRSARQQFDQKKLQIENELNQQQEQAIQGVDRVRDAVSATQTTLQTNGRGNITARNGVPATQTTSSLEQIQVLERDAVDAAAEIDSSLNRYWKRKAIYPKLFKYLGQITVIILALYIVYILLSLMMNSLGVYWAFADTGNPIVFAVICLPLFLVVGVRVSDSLLTTRSINRRYDLLMEVSSTVEAMHKGQDEALRNTRSQRLAEYEILYRQKQAAIEQALQKALVPYIPRIDRYKQEDGFLVAEWDDPRWLNWRPRQIARPLVRLGVMRESTSFPGLPALTICPSGENLLFKTPGAVRETAIQALQSLMLRVLIAQSPGKLRFTLIDPTGLGRNVATFLQLADYDEQLISGKAWTKTEQITQQLTELADHMENVIQRYLRNQYHTIDDYNRIAGEIAEPYRILVVVGFPANFSKEAANQLVNIAATGPRCGVSVLMTVDADAPLPAGFKLTDLERVAKTIVWDGQSFSWQLKDIGTCKLQLDKPPEPAIFNQLLQRIGEKALEVQQRVEIPFSWVIERHVIPEYRWWAKDQSTSEEIVVPLGRMGATKYQYLRLGKGTAHHVLIVGTTGSGKTNLLHVLVVGLSLMYSPDEVELYLVDFKTIGFTPYAHYKLPHARVVAIQSEREFGLSVLEGLAAEMEQRKLLFSKARVQDITQFRKARPRMRMPRILLLIDEFQELFMRQDKIAKEAAEHLNRFVRTGRGLGIHIILASQTLAGVGNSPILDSATITQMTVRIAMRDEKADSRLILSEDNTSASLLFQFRPGEAIYNADSGAEMGNNRFQSFWLSHEELSVYLDAIRQLAYSRNYVPERVQNIFDGSKNADVEENQALNDLLSARGWPIQQFSTIWLGDPISLKDTTNMQLRPRSGSNLLIINEDENVATGLLTIALFTLAVQHRPGTACFYIIDGRQDTPYVDRLRQREQQLPHSVKIANRRTLSSLLAEISNEIKNRSEADTYQKPPICLLIYGLHRIHALRSEEQTSSSLSKQLASIIRDGPEQGIHTLIWCGMLSNFNRALERNVLDEFGLRIAFQMSENDSTKLVGSPEASQLGPHRALLFKEGMGAPEKFIPYEPPSDEWLTKAGDCLGHKS